MISETSAADDAVDFFADVDENTDAAAAAAETISDQFAAEEDRVDFFADLPDESVAPVREETDDFGDFKIEYLDAGAYKLHIEAEGFAPVDQDVQLDKSLYLGDFPLVRA